jgi:hypothetical protein
MFKPLFVLAFFFFAQTSEPAILSPQAGETLRGKVQIIGNLNVPNFSSAEIAFSYASDSTSWFAIQTFSQIPVDQNLAMWDTSLVTDGDYVLHLRVFFQDGTSRDVVISDLKVRNDVAPDAATITPTIEAAAAVTEAATPLSLEAPSATPVFPTPTNLPPNPVTITSSSIFYYFARGGLIAIVVIFLFSLILRLRRD